jgi:protein-S-isoprenylcysteine O-methyltransferase Ste14
MTPRTRSVLATVILIGAIVVLFQWHALIARHPIAIAFQIAAVGLMLWARVTFGMRSFHASATPTAGGLVDTGPYRYWRHPIYAAALTFIWAGLLGQGHVPSLGVLLAGAVATAMTAVRIQAEETLLRAQLPEYPAYAARTKRLVPFVF